MNKTVSRSLLIAASAGVVGAGTVLAAAPAHADTPGDLKVSASVVCKDKQAYRAVAVQNVGGTKITGVRVGTVAGPEITVPQLEKNKPEKVGSVLVGSTDDIAAGTLDPGQSVVVSETSGGCDAPYAIVGYAIGDQIDNVFSAPNADFDWGMVPPAQG
ncbi:MAG: hypothetical protein QM774_09355 [Gordonia sp. (in: high G+C Gram-positive bacteria)]|uniref:hypothetical protein n=1 Tax=Gordonia sp. (in: high G+C Gram-positive bacteria) TaxID=84139 RepID=UPI0039E4C298